MTAAGRKRYATRSYATIDTRSRTALAGEVGPVIYARRQADGTIKIGHTTQIAQRMAALGGLDAVLAIMPGTRDDERAIHEQLVEHRAHGREYYFPAPAVLAIVNDMRAQYGFAPIAA